MPGRFSSLSIIWAGLLCVLCGTRRQVLEDAGGMPVQSCFAGGNGYGILPAMSLLFDAHCHATRMLSAPPPSPAGGGNTDRRRLVCGVSAADWNVVADWALRWEGTVPAFGVHPWEAGDSFDEGALEEWLIRFPSAWAGEIGLDQAKVSRAPMARQVDVFARQLRVAARLGRGVNVHCVRAYDALLDLLDKEYFSIRAGKCIVHSFAGAAHFVPAFVERGAYFSIGGLASRRDSPKIRGRVEAMPVERILLESDAFLEPGVDAAEDLLFTLRWIAGVKGMEYDTLAGIVSGNAQRILHGTD